jgi:hypothetical protein
MYADSLYGLVSIRVTVLHSAIRVVGESPNHSRYCGGAACLPSPLTHTINFPNNPSSIINPKKIKKNKKFIKN